jgi:hypothetical protein
MILTPDTSVPVQPGGPTAHVAQIPSTRRPKLPDRCLAALPLFAAPHRRRARLGRTGTPLVLGSPRVPWVLAASSVAA